MRGERRRGGSAPSGQLKERANARERSQEMGLDVVDVVLCGVLPRVSVVTRGGCRLVGDGTERSAGVCGSGRHALRGDDDRGLGDGVAAGKRLRT